MLETVCGKKDWGIRTGESDIKFERITELKIANEQVLIDIADWKCGFKIGNHRYSYGRCFLPADSFQNLIKFN